MEITKNSVGADYEFVPKESMVSENKWSFKQICDSFGSKIINDSPTYQRPDVAGSNLWRRYYLAKKFNERYCFTKSYPTA